MGRYGSKFSGRGPGTPPGRRALLVRVLAALFVLVLVMVMRTLLVADGGSQFAAFFGP